ncbi:MAG: Plug domain-containing protein [Thermoplasmatota archaeon]
MAKKKSSRFGRRLEVPAGAVYALLAAISLICVTVVAVAFADDGGIKKVDDATIEDIKIPHLFIDEVFFRSYENEGITVEITIYVTNDGTKDAYGVEAHIWPVVDESNIATDKKEISFGDIGVNQTLDQKIEILLNAGTMHSVEILVFESSRLVLKGVADVSTKGSGGSDYQTVEVRGTSDDQDYDGMPDTWENFYGLDPNNPNDADIDRDGDGVNNLMEYRLNRNPNLSPAEEAMADDDDGPDDDLIPSIGKDNGGLALGAILFLMLIVVVVIALIIAAAISSNKARKRSEEKEFYKDTPRPPPVRRDPRPPFEHVVKEGAKDEEVDYDTSFMDNHSP